MARTIRNSARDPMARKAALTRNTAIELRGQTKRQAKRGSWTDEALAALGEEEHLLDDCLSWGDALGSPS